MIWEHPTLSLLLLKEILYAVVLRKEYGRTYVKKKESESNNGKKHVGVVLQSLQKAQKSSSYLGQRVAGAAQKKKNRRVSKKAP